MPLAAPVSKRADGHSHLWIKICGITSAEALEAALAAGVDAVGFVFAPSVRRLDIPQARKLARTARGRCTLVAVMLHPSQSWLDEIVGAFEPDVLQTDLSDLERLRLPPDLPTLPVVRAAAGAVPARRLLYESAASGSGELADWAEAARLVQGHELILAGGLNAANVAAAVRAVQPFGVDVSSGVESAPGRKSPEMIHEFVHSARAAARERTDRDAD